MNEDFCRNVVKDFCVGIPTSSVLAGVEPATISGHLPVFTHFPLLAHLGAGNVPQGWIDRWRAILIHKPNPQMERKERLHRLALLKHPSNPAKLFKKRQKRK